MDIISFNEAATANGRIEKFIENPDSNSGIVTVPKVIEAGESVTVPAGRIAVLPNVQVDGEIVVESGAEIFVPSGSSIDFSTGIKVNGEKLTMSIPTAYHIYNGNVEATNTILTNGFSTTLYTGNGSTQSINTGIDMDTQWGDTAEEKFGGLVWLKSRSIVGSHRLVDTVRGINKDVVTSSTSTEASNAGIVASFNTDGFSVSGTYADSNQTSATYSSWNFQTTHRTSGTTNHGKPYTCHYNPYTGFTIVKYEGSGLVGHEIPHHLGRKLGLVTVKNLSVAGNWSVVRAENELYYLKLNLADADATTSGLITNFVDNSVSLSINALVNASTNQYIMYGWANSYKDVNNKLIGNYEVGVYQGTGASGNKVTTRGKPAWVMIKRLDAIGYWVILDNKRITTVLNPLYANASDYESNGTNGNSVVIVEDGFTCSSGNADINASGGQYLYMVAYDNDSGSGKSKYPKATDTTTLNINALVPYANGIDVNGSKVSIEYKNETITGLTLTQGKNYVYSKNDGTYGVSKYEPMYCNLRDRSVAGENPDYFDLKTMKWYGTTGGNELVTNGTFDVDTSGWTVTSPSTISVSTGVLSFTRASGGSSGFNTSIATETGKKYKIRYSISNNTEIVALLIGTALDVSDILYKRTAKAFTGFIEYEFVAQSTTTYLQIAVDAYITIKVDNISVFEVKPTIGAEITPRTYLDCIVYADHNGQVSYVEELPKTTYFDEIKANEFKGKNACTAWAYFTRGTPPSILDEYNIGSIIKVTAGIFRLYFKSKMDNATYTISGTGGHDWNQSVFEYIKTVDYVEIVVNSRDGTYRETGNINIQIFGGKN